MTSGFNIASNLTREPDLNEMMCFTANEISPLLQSTKLEGREKEKMIIRLKEYYDGYLFNAEGKERVFHSDMILYYFKHYLFKKRQGARIFN